MNIELIGLHYYIQTFGCQMNKHDSERIAGLLDSKGALQASSIEEADLVVFVTCCVREAADTRLYGQVSSIKSIPIRKGSEIGRRLIAVGGCIGQRDGRSLLDKLSHVDVVFGTHNIASLPDLIGSAISTSCSCVETVDGSDSFSSSLPIRRDQKWAAWLPITIGCDNFCSYCIVPYVRGREKSRPFQEIVEEARSYVDAGVKEITLLGQNVNSYGRDLYGKPRFADILKALDGTGVQRLRFATSHPKDLNDDVIGMFGTLHSLMPALHLPVQSGSSIILERMNRRYSREHYLSLIDKLRAQCSDIALSTDVIVGFPGESEDDFLQTMSLVEGVSYHQVFTFIYSKRAGTPAAQMQDDTPHQMIQDRFDRLVDVVQAQAYINNQRELGRVVDVLVEGSSKRDQGILSGRSPKNQTVHAPIPDGICISDLVGRIVPVMIDEARTWYLAGTMIG